MRKRILRILSMLVLLLMSGCHGQNDIPETPNTMHPTIVVHGELFSSTGRHVLVEPDDSVIKTVSSVVSGTEMPSREGEINFPYPDARYAKINDIEEYVVVMMDLEWVRFDKRTDVSP